MESTQDNLKLESWIGLPVYGNLKRMNTGDTLLTVVLREIFMESLLGQ